MNASLAGKKIAVWFKGRQIIHHTCVDHQTPTQQTDYPGTYLYLAVYDDMGDLQNVDLYADGFVISSSDQGGMAWGKSLPRDLDLA